MNSAQSRGLAGLSQSLEKSDQNDRNLQYMQQLSAIKQQEDRQKEVDQLKEQQYYDSLNKEADGLLAGDRAAIQKKALDIQSSIKEQIKLYGGNRSKFLQNGGHRLLKNYIDNVTGSEEMTTYKDNKENLVRIIAAQEKGFGARLMDRDIESMQQYQKNGKGKITYSGMMNEIEIPPEANYNLGADIPLDHIMNHNANKMKILGNYKMYYPDLEDPTQEELNAFASKMGYGGKGSNRDNIDFARKLAFQKDQLAKATTTRAVEDKRGTNIVVGYSNMLSKLPQTTVDQIYETAEDGSSVNWYKSQKNPLFQKFLGNWDHVAKEQQLDTDVGSDLSNKNMLFAAGRAVSNYFNDISVKLANSGQLFAGQTRLVTSNVLQQEMDEEGYVTIQPDNSYYDMAGTQTKGDNALDFEEYKGKYKVLGISSATKTKMSDGKEQLLVEIYDGDKYSPEGTKEFADKLKGSTVVPTAVLALQNDEGIMFYKEVPLGDAEFTNTLSVKMGDEAWMDDYNDSEQKQSEINQVSEKITAEKQEQLIKRAKMVNDVLDQTPAFKFEAGDWTNKENPDFNRSTLMRAFYSSLDSDPGRSADINLFSEVIASSGAEAEKLFKDYENSYSDREMIEKWLEIANKNVTPAVRQSNGKRAQNWLRELDNYYKLYN